MVPSCAWTKPCTTASPRPEIGGIACRGILHFRREIKAKRRAQARLAFDCDGAVVRLDQAMHHGQSEARDRRHRLPGHPPFSPGNKGKTSCPGPAGFRL